MQPVSLGEIADTGGNATPLTNDPTIRAAKIVFRARNANVGLVNVGVVGFTRGGAGMIAELLKPVGGLEDTFVLESNSSNDLYVSRFAVWPATNGDAVAVTYFKR
jgi:hypothetical protein